MQLVIAHAHQLRHHPMLQSGAGVEGGSDLANMRHVRASCQEWRRCGRIQTCRLQEGSAQRLLCAGVADRAPPTISPILSARTGSAIEKVVNSWYTFLCCPLDPAELHSPESAAAVPLVEFDLEGCLRKKLQQEPTRWRPL